MKEIKFRQSIWKDGKIIQWHVWGFKDGLYQHPMNMRESNQFTGRTDRQGEEIYEDDIIQMVDGTIHVVSFDYGAFGYRLHDTFAFLAYIKCDIIGNIHENPELLCPDPKSRAMCALRCGR